MTRARFKTEVKLFALNERSEGKSWQIIRQRIKERFNVEPPTVRAMEKWGKSLDRETITAELMKDFKQQLPKVEADAQVEVAQNLLPVLLKARNAGEDMEAAAWKWFFQWIDKWLGREKFKRLVEEYFSEQKEVSVVATKEAGK
jgi:hypothetical protein